MNRSHRGAFRPDATARLAVPFPAHRTDGRHADRGDPQGVRDLRADLLPALESNESPALGYIRLTEERDSRRRWLPREGVGPRLSLTVDDVAVPSA
jgi:hypothetical protein